MKPTFLRYTFITLVSVFVGVTLLSGATSSAQTKAQDTVVITDVATWKHPVKEILTRNKVQLSKVNLTKNNKYPVFYVTLPYAPQSSETTVIRAYLGMFSIQSCTIRKKIYADIDSLQTELDERLEFVIMNGHIKERCAMAEHLSPYYKMDNKPGWRSL